MIVNRINRTEMSIKPIKHEGLSIKPIKKGELPIKPVSINSSNPAFGAIVKSNTAIDKGFEMAFNLLKNPTLKDLESGKSFYDSMKKILASKNLKVFDIELGKQGTDVYPIINGSKLDIMAGRCPYVQDSYLVYEGCQVFADSLPEKQPKTNLDKISKKIFKMREQLAIEERKYTETLKAELQKLKEQIA